MRTQSPQVQISNGRFTTLGGFDSSKLCGFVGAGEIFLGYSQTCPHIYNENLVVHVRWYLRKCLFDNVSGGSTVHPSTEIRQGFKNPMPK